METCLDVLWELLRLPVSELRKEQVGKKITKDMLAKRYDMAEKSNNLIVDIFSELEEIFSFGKKKINMPAHVAVFQKALQEFTEKSVNGVVEGAKEAKRLTEECGLCAVCKGCSNKFYDDVIQENMQERSLPRTLENYFSRPTQMYYYQQSMRDTNERFSVQNRFLCLKGFSSSTPTTYSAAFDSECVGGGLYVNYKGLGIVIDPGIGFVKSMHMNGIYINDIDVVIITHSHLDHNADAKTISSLVYDLNSYNQRKNKIVKDVFELSNNKEHTITWIVDGISKQELRHNIKNVKDLKTFLGRKKQLIEGNKGIKMSAISTKHIKDNVETYGIRLFADYGDELSIGYTSDTAFFQELETFYSGSDILVFNVSDIYRKDVKGIQDKRSHLGYNGSVKLLKATEPRLAIASEFCCTNGDFRMGFMSTLAEELQGKCNVVIGEIGLNVHIPKMEVECSFCGKGTKMGDIRIIAPRKEYGKIQYSCGQCARSVL